MKPQSIPPSPPFSTPAAKETLESQGEMDPGEVIDGEEEVPRQARRKDARRRARRQLAEMILAARNRKDIEQFLEAFPLVPTLVMMISSTGQGGGQISILFRSLGRGGLGFCTHDAAVMFLCS